MKYNQVNENGIVLSHYPYCGPNQDVRILLFRKCQEKGELGIHCYQSEANLTNESSTSLRQREQHVVKFWQKFCSTRMHLHFLECTDSRLAKEESTELGSEPGKGYIWIYYWCKFEVKKLVQCHESIELQYYWNQLYRAKKLMYLRWAIHYDSGRDVIVPQEDRRK